MQGCRGLIYSNLRIPPRTLFRDAAPESPCLFSARSVSFARKNRIGHAAFRSYVPVHS